WGHFVAAGVWLGGLVALLFGLRGEPSEAKAARVRRFSAIAVVGLVVVLATGIVRSVTALSSWSELATTGYGRGITAKVALIALIACLGAVNRYRSVPAAGVDLHALRRTSAVELGLAASAVGVAALLGTLVPPAARQLAPGGLRVAGSDYGTTVRVQLTTASPEPGPNEFRLRASDFDTGDAVDAEHVSLRFTSLDDTDIAPSELPLTETTAGTYVGSGANLAVDGLWRVNTLIE